MRFCRTCIALVLLVAGGARALEVELITPPETTTLGHVASQAPAQPDLTAVRADFIPGDKTIFYDDFTDMVGDEPPPHWKVRGGMTELRVAEGIRQLTMPTSRMQLTPNLTGLPKNFTMEADIVFQNPTGDVTMSAHWVFMAKDGLEALRVDNLLTLNEEGRLLILNLHVGDPTADQERLAEVRTRMDLNQPLRQELWIQDGRLRVYVNGQRLIDVNQVRPRDIASLRFEEHFDGDTSSTAVGLRRVRFAESAPDFSRVITSTGRYVTHGIQFDVNSDRLKPESAPVIRLVARALEGNPNLKLRIEGHTDSTGDLARNLDLSKRRAEAVKAVLVAQFGIPEERLTTDGLGAAKPMESNDTPSGRSQNRRVEFVRQ